jgi:LmbE family N-acetylglucosaminyl deacetylase
MVSFLPARLDELLLVGAHCDDIAIGAGGTVLELCRAHPQMRVMALVLTGSEERRREERGALASFCSGVELQVDVLGLPDGRLPERWGEVKRALEALRQRTEPDLILAPARHDAHQDHRLLAELVPTAFRSHLTLGYEILKWESDLAQPNVYLPLSAPVLRRKVELLAEHYPSQQARDWFDPEAFTGLARIRGVQCHERYAEGFHLDKLVISTGRAHSLAAVGSASAAHFADDA